MSIEIRKEIDRTAASLITSGLGSLWPGSKVWLTQVVITAVTHSETALFAFDERVYY